MPLDLTTAQRKLDYWYEQEEIAATESYTQDSGGNRRQITRADLATISKRIDYWEKKVAQLSGRSRVYHGVPL
jgi:hypothetical protein